MNEQKRRCSLSTLRSYHVRRFIHVHNHVPTTRVGSETEEVANPAPSTRELVLSVLIDDLSHVGGEQTLALCLGVGGDCATLGEFNESVVERLQHGVRRVSPERCLVRTEKIRV